MRKLKFRAWDTKRNKMWYKHLAYNQIDKPHWFIGFDFDVKLIIMEYTGLLDKQNKEIYEGDIVTHWKEKRIINDLFELGHWLSECTFDPECAEVIGNIYENPELLKGD